MRTLILTGILWCTGIVLFAQNPGEPLDSRPLNGIYLNLLGDASLISVNYERIVFVSPAFALSGKLGLGYNKEFKLCLFGVCPPADEYATIPHHITVNFGKGRHFFEFGLGGTLISGNKSQPYLLYPIFGYRILPLSSNKTNFRLFAQIPFQRLEKPGILFSPIGLSLGVSF